MEKDQNNGNRLYTKWRNKYYRDVNCLQVNVAALTQKNFGVCLSTSEESEVESDEDMEQINATTQTYISYCKSHTIDTAKIIYDSLSPPSKKKARFALTICDNKPDGFDRQIRRDVGVNIGKEMSILEKSSEKESMSKLSQSVEDFFLQDHITKLCPDKKRTTTDLTTGKTIQLRFRMGTLNSLHQHFVSVSESDCSFSSFCRYVPSFVRKPKYNE